MSNFNNKIYQAIDPLQTCQICGSDKNNHNLLHPFQSRQTPDFRIRQNIPQSIEVEKAYQLITPPETYLKMKPNCYPCLACDRPESEHRTTTHKFQPNYQSPRYFTFVHQEQAIPKERNPIGKNDDVNVRKDDYQDLLSKIL